LHASLPSLIGGGRWFQPVAEPFISLLLYVIEACPVKSLHRRLYIAYSRKIRPKRGGWHRQRRAWEAKSMSKNKDERFSTGRSLHENVICY
jgi:hypothetical protein